MIFKGFKIFVFWFTFVIVNADFEWMYLYPYGQNVTLKPLKEKGIEQLNPISCKWLTPNGVELTKDNLDSSRYKIDNDLCELTIINIQKDTNGIYHSIINSTYITKAMLNYHGPPSKDFLDEYKWNLVAGFSTFGGILALFLTIFAIKRYNIIHKRSQTVTTDN